jgi:RNA polymerase sigma-70 factor (ECF subfamily)
MGAPTRGRQARAAASGLTMLTAGELIWLLAAVARGDEVAFERLFAATRDRLYGIVLRILRRPDIAERVLCESYLQIWRSAAEYDAKAATPMTWMVAIARGRALDVARKGHLFSDDESGTQEASIEALDQARTEVTDELRHLLFCLAQLDDVPRQMVLLAYYSGWSRDQLAAKFEQPAQVVKAAMRTTLLQMGGHLQP